MLDIYVVSFNLFNILFCTIVATKWKDAGTGHHVEYDQRPDIFRFGWEY